MGIILRPGIDLEDLTKLIKEDFENDCMEKVDPDKPEEKKEEGEASQPKTYDSLNDDKLFEALFELADTWC